jgi:asparagine synthase (glutamine-hydrolysing)
MCGIAGMVSFNKHVESSLLQSMANIMSHRGPDGEGIWISSDQRVGFSHRRLSIIDLSEKANQPMHDNKRRGTIVFNGEIYNSPERRTELLKEGASFFTDHSDTETLLQGYLTWGEKKLLKRINGMFAFVIYDRKHQKIIMARDRVGIKPLYYIETGDGVVFASEIKALLLYPNIKAELDKESFFHYLSLRAIPSPKTLFKGIKKLNPGGYIIIDLNSHKIKKESYWDPVKDSDKSNITLNQAADRLEELLYSSGKLRMISDVPVGVFLSGGIDSTYLLKIVSDNAANLSSFTVSYPGHEEYNEDHIASSFAATVGTLHHDVRIDQELYVDALGEVTYYQDEPIAAPVCTSVYFLSRAAKMAKVPVILTGEGADELFIGYRKWVSVRNLQRINNLMYAPIKTAINKPAFYLLSKFLPTFNRYPEFIRRAGENQPLFWSGSIDFSESSKMKLIGPEIKKAGMGINDTYYNVIQPLRNKFLENADPNDITGWMSYMDLKFRLPELMLMRLDKMGMAFSIESRVPYLDHRIIEFVMGLPSKYRCASGSETKPLLKSVMSRKMDNDFVYRKKMGFGAPLYEWRDSMGEYFFPRLKKFAEITGLFDADYLKLLLDSNGRLYFNLVNFMLWYLIFIENVLENYFSLSRFKVQRIPQ